MEEMKKFFLKKTLSSPKIRALLLPIFIFFLANALWSLTPPENFTQAVLSNGMALFICEDFSAPTVTIEYTARAGFSCQTAATAGFAPLYARLFKTAGLYSAKGEWLLEDLQSECLADCSSHAIDASPSQTEEIFRELSFCAFAPIFSDGELGKALAEQKEAAAQNAFSAEGFINSAIDSRVFSAAPWKRDSGIHPALFNQQSLSEARAALSEMSKRFYSPQNSALFVTGAVTKEKALFIAEKTFGSFSPTAVFPQKESLAEQGEEDKKFVLSDPELSPDMAQAVVEWTSLSMEEADIAAAILNERSSRLKAALTEEEALNIRGSDYINAEAAHINACSRLIVQALLEKGEKSINYFDKSALFEKILLEEAADFTQEEFERAKNFLLLDFELAAKSPRRFMKLLSQFWAVDGMAKKSYDQSGASGDASSLAQRFLARKERLMAQDMETLKFSLANEDPYLFILLNSKAYAPLSAAFEKSGWKSVTQKNASWHSQKMYAAIKESIKKSKEAQGAEADKIEPRIYDKNFVEKAKLSAKSFELSNSMRVHTKTNSQSATSAVCLYIKGGEAQSAQSQPGLEAILTSALLTNVQKAAQKKAEDGLMGPAFFGSALTSDTSGLVALECLKGDEEAALECFFDALVFGDLVPAEFDRALMGRKSEQIIKSGAMPRQLWNHAIKAFYKSPLYRALNSGSQEILKNVPYSLALESYAKLLDAGRLEIIAVGNFNAQGLAESAEKLFGSLDARWQEKEIFCEAKIPAKNSQRVKINHTFLTDVSADKAGPRPAVLVPTTDFADPAQYWFCAPKDEKEAALFDALMARLCAICKKIFEETPRYQKMTARLEEKSPLVSFGVITIFNVQYISDADAAMQKALEKLKEEIFEGTGQGGDFLAQNPAALDGIKNLWLKSAYENADQNLEAAKAIAKMLDSARAKSEALDLQSALVAGYESVTQASAADFAELYKKSFEKFFKFYSADAKK